MSSQESSEPTGDSLDEDFRLLLQATLSECRDKLSNAIDALEANDPTAYASAIRDFSTVRSTASRWIDEMSDD